MKKKRIVVEFYERDIELLLHALGNYQSRSGSSSIRESIGYVINRIYRAMGVRLD